MKYILIAGLVIVVVFLGVLYFIPLGVEPLTEMYFNNHTQIPVNIYLLKPYNFSFSVHNLEYQDMNYNYTITQEYNNKTITLEKGTFNIKNNETKTISSNFSIKEHFGRARTQVIIDKIPTKEKLFNKKLWWPDPNYPNKIDIHFWVDEIKGMTITITPD